MRLVDLGWNTFFEKNFEPYRDQGLSALRITRENRGKYIAFSEHGEFTCELSGKFRFEADSKGNFPAVGDWVAAAVLINEHKATIHAVLPRTSSFSRKVAGQVTDEQIIAANIDTMFIVAGLDADFNIRRIERYATLAWNSGSIPVLLLNKADLCSGINAIKSEVESVAPGIEVHAISASTGSGMDILNNYIHTGNTVAFIGSSGVGKSTIINTLLGSERFPVNEVSDLGCRGRHTTTFRELVVLPNGGMVIDTPGMRELQVWGDTNGLDQVFNDIKELASNCRFRDCSHENEPDCAVRSAIDNGTLSSERFNSYVKLQKEFSYLSDRKTMKASAVEKKRWKKISQYVKDLKKHGKLR